MTFWLTLGDFDGLDGLLVEVTFDGHNACAREVLRYRPPPDRQVHGKGFTGLAVGVVTWLCGFNALHRLEAGRIVHSIFRNEFNDLHHVVLQDDQLWVTNTGLDRVEVLTQEGDFLGAFDLLGAQGISKRLVQFELQDGYFGAVDEGTPFHQRRVRDRVHPNHVAHVGDQVLVNRFLQGQVVDLVTWRPVIELAGHPHDGQVHQDLYWLTCTDGRILAFALEGGRVTSRLEHRLDVFDITERTGWCRGLWVGPDLLAVGLTAIDRMPRARWCDRPFEHTETALLLLDPRTGALRGHVPLGGFGSRPKLFAVQAVNA